MNGDRRAFQLTIAEMIKPATDGRTESGNPSDPDKHDADWIYINTAVRWKL
jgi:hypothetical protein